MASKKRVAVVVSHPIQHFCPQYESWGSSDAFQLRVFFGSALGYKSYYDSSFQKEISWSNIRLERFDHVFLNGDQVLKADAGLDAPNLDKELDNYKPDLVIVYGYFQALQRRAYRWARKNKVKLAYISDSENRQKRTWWKQVLKYPFLKRYFSKIDYFLSVGDANEAYYGKYGVRPAKLERMHFPIDIKRYEESFADRELLRKEIRVKYNIPEGTIVGSVVGKVIPLKNQDHIIDAMLLLEQRRIYLHLFVIGSGEMVDLLKEKAKGLKHSKVYFTGFMGVDDLPAYYAASDLYIHPATLDAHPLAVSEAIYMGCPVIISHTCGSHGENDDVQQGKNGIVYPFGNIEALSKAIADIITSDKILHDYGNYSHKIAVSFQDASHFKALTNAVDRI